MPLRKRVQLWKDKVKHGLGLSSHNPSTSSLPNVSRLSPSPAPPIPPHTPTPPDISMFPTHTNLPTDFISASTATISSDMIAPTTMSPNPVPHNQPKVPIPSEPPVLPTGVSVNKGGSTEDTKVTAWDGLKTLLKVVESGAESFGPLKSAVGGLNQCVEIFETASKARKEYDQLGTNLDALLGDLGRFLGNTEDWMMTASMTNLSIGLNQEVQLLQQKSKRGVVQRHAEAFDDWEETMECYRRIQGQLERLSLNANLSMWGMVNKLEMGLKEARLRQLLPAMSAVYDSAESQDVKRRACTPGTRKGELARLLSWVHDKQAGDVYWMNGMAGTGKTTIAYSLCDQLKKTSELGASFFCSRLIPECRNVKFILPAIAYQLARFSYPFRCALLRVLEADPDAHTRVLKMQFENLLVKPLSDVKHALPADFMVVIDALDECENEDGVGQIIEILLQRPSDSSIPVRFLVSSRPEPDIYSRMMKRVGANSDARLVLHELDVKNVKHDIETYLQAELENLHLEPSQVAALVEHSGVLFIYAATAARYIRGGHARGAHITRLNMILGLSPASPEGNDRDIDKLYSSILEAAFRSPDLDAYERVHMKTILDTVVCTQEPLTPSTLARILKLEGDMQVEGLLRPLYSVLNIAEASRRVTTLHASFPNFILDHRRSSSFHCDQKLHHWQLAQACLGVIKTNVPQFNICALASSYLRDDQVVGLTQLAEKAVSPELFYACRYWIAHWEIGAQGSDQGELLFDFLSTRLLLWMEVLNVRGSMHLGGRILQRAETWSRMNGCPNETTELAHDAWRFVTTFAGNSMSCSTPHLYVSALPFWPKSAPIAEHYTKRLQNAIEVRGTATSRRQLALLATCSFNDVPHSACFSPDGSLIAFRGASSVCVVDASTWRMVVGPLEHGASVTSVAFSPNGRLIASGCADNMIWVWNAQSGQSVNGPITGHTGAIDSVSFSPDSTHIVTGSNDGTIRVWNLHTRDTVLGPLKCSASGNSHSVCFSTDGTRIASTSIGSKLQVWDAQSGQPVMSLIGEGTYVVTSVCFSVQNSHIASGFGNNIIRVWSAKDGWMVGTRLKGHSNVVQSIAFSPNGDYIVSGSDDKTIRLWDLTSDPISSRILEGHTGPATSVAFSSDGSRIVSCSDDKTIRVWDARSRATVADSLEGHTGAVYSVGYSPDGKRVVSGSADSTIRMWDAESGQMVGGPLEGHTGVARSVCFSPDGRRIVSGSDDGTIRAWDVQSGQTVVGPLEGHRRGVRSICLSPDGALIASGSADETTRVWDAHTGKPVGSPLEEYDDWVRSVCFSPDSTRIASGSDDQTILVWDAKSGRTVAGPLEGHTNYVLSVCFSPDGTRLASGSKDKTVRVWDVQQGQAILGPLEGHTGGINSVCFSPSGTLFVSGSDDQTVRLWDARSGQAVGDPLVGHTGAVWSVAFSPDGKQIVSGSSDQTIRVWDVDGILRMYGAADFLPSPGPAPISPPRPHESWVLREDGWVVDHDSRLQAWVPPDLHAPLLRPHNTLRISAEGDLKLNFDSANLGESWAECYQAPTS